MIGLKDNKTQMFKESVPVAAVDKAPVVSEGSELPTQKNVDKMRGYLKDKQKEMYYKFMVYSIGKNIQATCVSCPKFQLLFTPFNAYAKVMTLRQHRNTLYAWHVGYITQLKKS